MSMTMIVLLLVLVTNSLSNPWVSPYERAASASGFTPIMTRLQPTSTTPYISTFQFARNSGILSPWVLYPQSDKTVWVIGLAGANPFISQIINFTLGVQPKVVLNITNAAVPSIAVDSNRGRVYFTFNDTLAYYDMASKRELTAIVYPGGSPQFITIDAGGHVWSTLDGTNQVAEFDPSNSQNRNFTVPTSQSILQGIALAPDGTIWFTEARAKKLGRLDPSTGNMTEYSSSRGPVAPLQLTVGLDGVVWFTDHGSNEFGSFNPKTGDWTKYPIGYCPGFACVIGLPNAMFVDQNGMVWFSEHIPGRIGKYDPVSDILTEYIIPVPPGTSSQGYAYAWWAALGPENLVWFTAWGYGEIGYVNSSIPVNSNIRADKEITVERGLTAQLTVGINHESQGTVSVGVNPSYQDQSGSQPSISGSFIQNVLVGSGLVTATIGVTAAWNAQDGPRAVMVTASDDQVAVSVPVKVNVVEPILIYLGISGASGLVATAVVLYLRRRHRRGVRLSPSGKPIEPVSPHDQSGN